MLQQVQLYDDSLDFEENKAKGPFGDYADTELAYENPGEPKYDFFGTSVYSPFGIAAGPLPTTQFISSALRKGFDIVTLKSVRTDSFPLNPYPQVRPIEFSGDLDPDTPAVLVTDKYSMPLAVANSFGIPSVPPAKWQPDMRTSLKLPKKGQALLVAFQGTAHGKGREDFIQDHLTGIGLVRQTGAQVVEINLSCPNEGEEVLACFDIDITERIVKSAREANPDLKLIIKLAYFSDPARLKKLIKRVGDYVDGISAINTIPAPVVDKTGNEVFPGRPKAGISGAPIRWAGLEMTGFLKKFRDELGYGYKILGMGGVLSPDDFYQYRKAGADIVMAVTGAMWNPSLAAQIKQSLK
ncbi:MAG: dihydroorotate oxidase [Candidatus Colwellbacteria bacterium]